MRRYLEEHQRRRRLNWQCIDAEDAKAWGANRIRYPGSPRRKRWILAVWRVNPLSGAANALSIPPGEYGRKAKTQRN